MILNLRCFVVNIHFQLFMRSRIKFKLKICVCVKKLTFIMSVPPPPVLPFSPLLLPSTLHLELGGSERRVVDLVLVKDFFVQFPVV